MTHPVHRAMAAAALALLASTTPAGAAGVGGWQITDLGVYEGKGLALNDQGWVVTGTRLLVPGAGGYTSTTLLSAAGSTANFWLTDVNNSGAIVGVDASAGRWQGFVQQGAARTLLPQVADWSGYRQSIARAINDSGQIVGNTGDSAVRWDPLGGSYTVTPLGLDLDPGPGVNIGSGDGVAINGSGHGLISQTYNLYRAGYSLGVGQTTVVGELPGYTPLGRAINDSLAVAGFAVYDCGGYGCSRPYVWQGDTVTWLPETLHTGYAWINGEALALNERGQVVGQAWMAPYEQRALLWTSTAVGWQETDLNTVLPAGSDFWRLSQALDVNERGQIAGVGAVAGDGVAHVFLLTPVPEPATWTLWLGGVAALGAWRRRRSRA